LYIENKGVPVNKKENTNYKPWQTFSIFISSTFADMQSERDHLKNVVFPKVEAEFRKRQIRLETVDLLWIEAKKRNSELCNISYV
jgi:hypothetical protein